MTFKLRVKVKYFLKSVVRLLTHTPHSYIDGVPSYKAQWLLMKRSLKARFHIVDVILKSTSHLHKTYIQLIQWAPLSFLERECSYLAIWLPMVCCLFDLILFIPVNIFSVMSEWLFLGLNWHSAGFNVSCLSCLFHAALWSLLRKGWPLGSLVCDVFLFFSHLPLPYRVLGHALYLIASIPELCILLYFAHGQYAVSPVRLKPATLLSRLKHSTMGHSVTGYCTRILCGDYEESFSLLLWPWSKRTRSNISYKCWHEFLSHFC